MRSRFLSVGWILPAAALAAGCTGGRSELDVIPPDAGTDAPPVPEAGPPPIETSDKVDLLLVVDNSPNTDNFRGLFAETAPYLVSRFAHPACVNGLGNVVAVTANDGDPCPDGQREFQPVQDVHIAVVSSSLGGHGADACSPASPGWNPAQNDAGHLLTRGPGDAAVPTYQGQGFLAWDPAQKLSPPGESDVGVLGQNVADLAGGAGDQGCGFEASLESMYRFLVDPEPYQTIPIVSGAATPTGTDTTVLQQRSDFLRPDSALVVVLITDEDDCSVQAGGQYYLALQGLAPGNPNQLFHLPPPRSVCAQKPDDPCCASCGEPTPAGCPADPACSVPALTDLQDPINLRCFDQKRRFGVDFLYPVQRYVDGLTSPTITARDGSAAPNPLYAGNRSPKLVMMAGILGVPWQDIAKAPKSLVTGYQTASEIDWGLVLGDPQTGAPPGDPLMIKSVAARTGMNPPTGEALAAPSSPLLANPINGHERDIAQGDDLQFACIYPLATPVACVTDNCNCVGPGHRHQPRLPGPRRDVRDHRELFARALPSTPPAARAPGARGSGQRRLGVRRGELVADLADSMPTSPPWTPSRGRAPAAAPVEPSPSKTVGTIMMTLLRSRRRLAALGVMIAACTGGCVVDDEAVAPVPSGYHVTGGFLRDPEGRALLLRGMNLSGEQKEAPYLDFHQLPDYQRVRDPWGMNAIRFITTWAAIEPVLRRVRRGLPRPGRGAHGVGAAGRAPRGARHAPGRVRRGLRLRRRRRRAPLDLRRLALRRLHAQPLALVPQRPQRRRHRLLRPLLADGRAATALRGGLAAPGRAARRL